MVNKDVYSVDLPEPVPLKYGKTRHKISVGVYTDIFYSVVPPTVRRTESTAGTGTRPTVRLSDRQTDRPRERERERTRERDWVVIGAGRAA